MNAATFRRAIATDQHAAVMRALEAADRETRGALALLEDMRICKRTVASQDLVCDAITKIEDAQAQMNLWLAGQDEDPMDVCRAMRRAP